MTDYDAPLHDIVPRNSNIKAPANTASAVHAAAIGTSMKSQK